MMSGQHIGGYMCYQNSANLKEPVLLKVAAAVLVVSVEVAEGVVSAGLVVAGQGEVNEVLEVVAAFGVADQAEVAVACLVDRVVAA